MRIGAHGRKPGMRLPLSKIAEFISAPTPAPTPAATSAAHTVNTAGELIQGYSIDSRAVAPGQIFFAVKGERLDGHDYVNAALEKGAAAAVVRKDQLSRYPDTTQL